MVTAAEIGNPAKVHSAGMKALMDALGFDGTVAFLQQSAGIPGRDFAKWLKEQPKKSPDEIEAEIMRLAAAEPSPQATP